MYRDPNHEASGQLKTTVCNGFEDSKVVRLADLLKNY